MSFRQKFNFTDLLVLYMRLEEKIPWALYLGSVCFIIFGIYLWQAEMNLIVTGSFYYISKSISAAIIWTGCLILVLTVTRAR